MKILIIDNGYIGQRCLGQWPNAIVAVKQAIIRYGQEVSKK
jgi:hypothetical protein